MKIWPISIWLDLFQKNIFIKKKRMKDSLFGFLEPLLKRDLTLLPSKCMPMNNFHGNTMSGGPPFFGLANLNFFPKNIRSFFIIPKTLQPNCIPLLLYVKYIYIRVNTLTSKEIKIKKWGKYTKH